MATAAAHNMSFAGRVRIECESNCLFDFNECTQLNLHRIRMRDWRIGLCIVVSRRAVTWSLNVESMNWSIGRKHVGRRLTVQIH